VRLAPSLKIVAVLLLVWEPLNFAATALNVWPTLAYRGWIPAAELVLQAMIAALCAAAGMMLLNDAPDGRRIARAAVILSVARVVSALYWSALPRHTAPGAEPVYAATAIVIGVLMLLVLREPSTQAFQ
jgi:hypothetical protein